MPTLSKLYTMQEASQHNTKDDCWIVIDNKIFKEVQLFYENIMGDLINISSQVYDVTSYLDEHPGGDDVVLAATEKDATDEFEDAGHSKDARELLQSFFIGELDTSSLSIPELEISSKSQSSDYAQKLKNLTKQYWAVPVAVVSISVVVGFLYLRKK